MQKDRNPTRALKNKNYCFSSKMNLIIVEMLLLLLVPIYAANYKNNDLPELPGIYFERIGGIRFVKSTWKILVFWDTNITKFDADYFRNAADDINRGCHRLLDPKTCGEFQNVIGIIKEKINNAVEVYDELMQDLQDIEDESVGTLTSLRRKRVAPILGTMTSVVIGALSPGIKNVVNSMIDKVINSNQSIFLFLAQRIYFVSMQALNYFSELKDVKAFVEKVAQIMKPGGDSGYRKDGIRNNFLFSLYRIQLEVDESEQFYRKMSHIIRSARMGKLHPSTIKRSDLRKLIKDVMSHNSDSEFPVDTLYANAEKLSMVSSANVAFEQGRFVIEINVPLIDQHDTIVYKIHSLFVPLSDGSSAAVDSKNEYMAIGHKRSFYTFMTQYEFDNCIASLHHRICDVHTPFYSTDNKISCEYLLKTQPNENHLKLCNIVMKKKQSNYYIGLQSSRGWLYSVKDRAELDIQCPLNPHTTLVLTGTGILELKPGCVATENGTTLKSLPQTQFESTYKAGENYWSPRLSLKRIIDDKFLEKTKTIFDQRVKENSFLMKGETVEQIIRSNKEIEQNLESVFKSKIYVLSVGLSLLALATVVMVATCRSVLQKTKTHEQFKIDLLERLNNVELERARIRFTPSLDDDE